MYSYLVKISPWRPLAEAVDLARTCALEALKDSEIRRRGGARVDPTSESSVVAVNNFVEEEESGNRRDTNRHVRAFDVADFRPLFSFSDNSSRMLHIFREATI